MKQLKQLLLVMAIALTGFTPAQAQTPTTFTHYSEWMANTQKSYVYKSNDYWRYDDGLMYESILDTYEQYKNGGGDFTDETLKNAVKTYIDHCIDGSGNLLEKYEDNTLDDIRPARMVYKYYKLYGGNNLLKACQTVMNCAAFSDNYRVINHSTGYPWQHKSNYAHQVWLDGIFMGLPYWTLAGPDGVHSSHHTSWTANDYFNDAYNQMQITDEKTYEPEIGLWCHAWDEYFESTTNTPQYWSMKNGKFTTGTFKDYHTNYEKTRHEGRSSHCWGRAAGWFAMAIMETMDNISAVDANYTHLTDLQTLFKKVIDAVWEKRDPTTGMWRCVLDVDDSTGDYKTIKDATGRDNYLEATCSAMFTYCLLHGVAKGYLPASYLDKAKSSYRGLIHTFITTDGGLKLNNCMEVGGLGGTTTIDKTDYDRDGSFAYYTIEKKKANDSKGVGPFIWASLEAEKIGYNMETNSFGPIDEKTIVNFAWSKASDEITQGASYTSPTFTAKTYGNDTPLTNSETVDFASDNTSVATVGTNGTVTLAGGTGTAHITAALKEGSTYTWSGTNPTYTITVNAPDTSAPTLSSSTPTNSATNVATSGNIVLTFDENVACTTNATLTPNGGSAINLTPSVSGSTVTYSYSGLSNSTSYTFNLAANSVADLAGNKYANAINITFTTTTETDKYYILAYTEMTPAGVLTSASNSNQSLKYVKYNGSTFATTTEISSTFPTNSKNGKYSNSSITNVLNTSNWASGSGSSYATGIMLSKNTTYTLNLNSNNISKISFLCYPAGNTSSISIGGTAKTTSTKEWTLHEWSGSFTGEVLITLSNANDIYGVFVLEKASGSTPPTPSTFTLNNTVNTSGYGTVSPASVSNIPSGTTVTAGTGDNINKYTVGETTVTATPATATDEYTYTFSGWSGLPATVTANTTVTANFTRTAKEYTLAWNSNGGSELTGDYTSGTVSFGTAITAPNNPTRDGYTFNGWNSAQNGSGTAPGSTMPAANTTYYAQWTENTPVVEQVATPSITGTTPFTDNTTVTITCATSDANIYYTTNGDTPTSSCTHYTAPFSIDATTTIKAIAIKSGMTESEVASATFTKSGGGGGTSATITYNLTTNTSSTTFNSCASVSPTSGDIIASSTINKYGSAGASSSNSAKADETQKLNIDNSYTANNYYEWTFTVGNGKNFSPSQVVMKFQAVSDLVQYKVDLTDGTSTYTTNFANTVSTAETLEQLTWNITPTAELTGTVRLKLWAYKKNNSASAFRLGSPITITGTVGEASLAAPTFTAHPANATYTQGDTPTALSVTATGNPAPTYQWYKNTDNDKTAKVADQIEGATAATLPVANISTATAGTFYYYCVATNSEGTATSNSATITVNAPALAISTQPTGTTYTQNASATALSVTATGGSTPYSYQWYSNDTNDTTTPTAVGTNSDSYTPSTTTVGTTYYYCIVTDNASATVTSNIVAITVNTSGGGGGSGTVLFSQDFKDATEVAYAANTARTITSTSSNNIVGTTNTSTQFTSITCDAKKSCGLGINSSTGGNSKDYTGKFGAYYDNTGGYWSIVKTTNFATTAPSAIKVEMNASFAAVSQGSNIGVQLAVGSGFNNGLTNSCPALSSCVAGFALPSSGAIRVAKYVTSNGITSINNTSSTLTDGYSYKYTWVINNTNETLTYKGPDGNNTTVDAKCWDLWIGPSKNLAGITQTTTGMSGTSLQNLYIGSPFGKKHEFILDDIKVYDLTPTEVAKVATPEITPADGTVFEGTTQNVSISCSTSGASIYYTLDGTDPTTSSIPYNSAFTIYGTKTVKAIAIKEGMTNSIMAAATITNTCLNEYTDGTLLLKQNATEYTPVAASGVTVTLERSLQANKWNPMCLPFDITPSMFSQTTQIETLQKVSNGVFTFAPTNSVPAGTPFIAKPAANIANPVFEDVEVKAVDAGSDIKDGYTFQGNYTKVTLDPETNLFISMSQQKLVSPTGSNILQGLRGYFIVPSGEGARFSLNFDGEMIVTDINRLNIEHLPFAIDDKTPIYNLSGQRVSKDYKGIVIINGKKFVRK